MIFCIRLQNFISLNCSNLYVMVKFNLKIDNFTQQIRECIQKFPDSPRGVRAENVEEFSANRCSCIVVL